MSYFIFRMVEFGEAKTPTLYLIFKCKYQRSRSKTLMKLIDKDFQHDLYGRPFKMSIKCLY
jgi:hypothetical protein